MEIVSKYKEVILGGQTFKVRWNFGARVEFGRQRSIIEGQERKPAPEEMFLIALFAALRCNGLDAPTLAWIEQQASDEEILAAMAVMSEITRTASDGGLPVPEGKSEASLSGPVADDASKATGASS